MWQWTQVADGKDYGAKICVWRCRKVKRLLSLLLVSILISGVASAYTYEDIPWGSSVEEVIAILDTMPDHDTNKLKSHGEAPGTICLTEEEAKVQKQAYRTTVHASKSTEGTGICYTEGQLFYSFIYSFDENGIDQDRTNLIGVRWRNKDDAAKITAAQERKPDLEVGVYKIWYDGDTMLATSSNEVVYGVTGLYEAVTWLSYALDFAGGE